MREIGQRGGMGRKGGGERERRYKRRLKMEGRRGETEYTESGKRLANKREGRWGKGETTHSQ